MWSGSNFSRALGSTQWATDAAANVGIQAGIHDTADNDLATGIDNCLNKNGANAPTANLSMGGFKHTNVAVGTADSDSATFGQTKVISRIADFPGNPISGTGAATAIGLPIIIPKTLTITHLTALPRSNMTGGYVDFILYKNGSTTTQKVRIALSGSVTVITPVAFAVNDLLQIYMERSSATVSGADAAEAVVYGYYAT